MENKNVKMIIGVEKLDYFSKKSNQQVKGVCVYIGVSTDAGIKPTDNAFFRNAGIDDFEVGMLCEPYYNKFGQVIKLVEVDEYGNEV